MLCNVRTAYPSNHRHVSPKLEIVVHRFVAVHRLVTGQVEEQLEREDALARKEARRGGARRKPLHMPR